MTACRLPMQTLLKCEQVLEKLDFTNKQVNNLYCVTDFLCEPLYIVECTDKSTGCCNCLIALFVIHELLKGDVLYY